MPGTLAQLGRELSKQAGVSSLESSLPIVLRPLPDAAIKAGEKLANVTGGRNVVEERLLGVETAATLLGAPAQSMQVTHQGQLALMSTAAKSGSGQMSMAQVMCGTCHSWNSCTRHFMPSNPFGSSQYQGITGPHLYTATKVRYQPSKPRSTP